MKKCTIGWLLSALSTVLILSFTSCNKSDNNEEPMPGQGVMGDWVTLAGTNYYNILFSSNYNYSIRTAQDNILEGGSYTVDLHNGIITLMPEKDGTKARNWSYKYTSSDVLSVTGRILAINEQETTLTLTRQASYEVKEVTVHSTATESKLKPEMLLGSPKIKLLGEINQGDFEVLRECEPMRELDMSAVRIVGDILVMTDSEGQEHTVEGNAIPEAAFGEDVYNSREANTTLERIVLPTSLETIGFRAFCGCQIGGILEIPKKTLIMMQAFSSCSQLNSVIFPEEVTDMHMAAFEFCTNLSGTINFPKGVGGAPAGVFRGCINITAVVLPEDATTIGEYAFIGCRKLKSINLPESLELVYGYAFTNCESLNGVLTLPQGMQGIGQYAFSGSGYEGTLTIPESIMEMHAHAFKATKFSSIVLKWKEGEAESTFTNALTWFPDQFKVGMGTKTIKIPKGQTAWYTANMPAPVEGCIYNLEEQ